MTAKYNHLTNEELRALCIENRWFTCGTTRQYEKLFDANNLGVSETQLAWIIWLCSDENWSVTSIADVLVRACNHKLKRSYYRDLVDSLFS